MTPSDKLPPGDFPVGLSQPALRALAHAEIHTLEQVTRHSEKELLALHGMGPKGIRILRAAMQSRGLAFRAEQA